MIRNYAYIHTHTRVIFNPETINTTECARK